MRRVIYLSTSRMSGDPVELDAIVRHASARNEAVNITGMLWTDTICFLQVLEGDHDAVSLTLRRIQADRRHSGMDVLCDRAVTRRMFGNSAMARPGTEVIGTESTALLVGFLSGERSGSARQAHGLLLEADM